jgi:Flp pilus assembly pilin Flp
VDVRRRLGRQPGQTTAEFALIVGGIALVCVVGVLILGGGIGDLFGSNANPFDRGGPFVPPRSGTVTFPDSAADCIGNGWQDYAQFTGESECLDYVASLVP